VARSPRFVKLTMRPVKPGFRRNSGPAHLHVTQESWGLEGFHVEIRISGPDTHKSQAEIAIRSKDDWRLEEYFAANGVFISSLHSPS
jgi:hypothetical protein